MNLEQSIKDVISKKLEDGTVEKLIAEHVEQGVKNALENMFRSYGDVAKVIEEQVKSVMVPYLEGYDYSKYIVKLDSVLVEVLKSSALENKKLLTNFKDIMVDDDIEKTVCLSWLYAKWLKYVSKNIDTSKLEIDFDDGPHYEYAEVTLTVENEESRPWLSFEHATVIFECEKDDDMNFAIKLSRWKDRETAWNIDYNKTFDINSLRYLNELEILLLKLDQARTKIELDMSHETDEIEVDAEPEASFS